MACLISSYSTKRFWICIAVFELQSSHGGGFSISSIFYLFLKQLRFRCKRWVHIFILVIYCHVSSNVLRRFWDKQSFWQFQKFLRWSERDIFYRIYCLTLWFSLLKNAGLKCISKHNITWEQVQENTVLLISVLEYSSTSEIKGFFGVSCVLYDDALTYSLNFWIYENKMQI